jgi:hypothetical protein
MAPDSLTPTRADDQLSGGVPAADLISRIEEEMTRSEQQSKSLKQQAAQKDQQLAEMRVRFATLAGTKSQAVKTPQIGQTIAGKGIYLGVWEPKDREGRSLNRRFAVYAAPEDLKAPSGGNLLKTFRDMAQEVASLRNWHGADGGSFANDAALYTALKDGTGVGKWFIPPRELLVGTDLNGATVRDDNLYAHRNTGDFKNSFTTIDNGSDGNSGYAVCYWSCTDRRDSLSHVWTARFSDGVDAWSTKHTSRVSCRPCRVEALVI